MFLDHGFQQSDLANPERDLHTAPWAEITKKYQDGDKKVPAYLLGMEVIGTETFAGSGVFQPSHSSEPLF